MGMSAVRDRDTPVREGDAVLRDGDVTDEDKYRDIPDKR